MATSHSDFGPSGILVRGTSIPRNAARYNGPTPGNLVQVLKSSSSYVSLRPCMFLYAACVPGVPLALIKQKDNNAVSANGMP